MNYGKYDAICCKHCFYLLICNELSCIDQGNQLPIITNTMNIITFLQPSNFNVFLHGYFLQCRFLSNDSLLYLKSVQFILELSNCKPIFLFRIKFVCIELSNSTNLCSKLTFFLLRVDSFISFSFHI